MKKRKSNTFINIIKENYLFLLLLTALTVIISIQGCYPLGQPQFTPGNCCKIKDSADNQVKACVAGSLTQLECDALASSQGNLYSFALGSSCINFERNPDCGVDATNNKIGCYLDDGSGVKRFFNQYDPSNPLPGSHGCAYGSTKLYRCEQGREVLVHDCATYQATPTYCVNRDCTSTAACTPRCITGQGISNCNTLCCGPGNIVTMHLDNYDDFTGNTINLNKWNVNNNAGMFSITQNDKLLISKGATAVGFNKGSVNTLNKLTLIGDFSVQVDFNLVNFPIGSASSGNQFQLEVSDGITTWIVARQNWGVASYGTWNGTSTWGGASAVGDTGKLKLQRQGTTLYAYYYDISSETWKQIGGSTSISTTLPIFVIIALQNNNGGDALSVEVDNFVASVTLDSSGNGNHGLIKGNTIISTTGKYRNALGFDGSSSYVELPDINAIDGAATLTVSAWIKYGSVDGLTVPKEISRKENVYALVGGVDPHKVGFLINNGVWRSSGSSLTNIDDGNWHYITGVYDGNNVKIYIDGVLESSRATGSTTLSSNANKVYIGVLKREEGDYIEHWNGIIDELSIFNRALTAQEILNRYNGVFQCTDYS